MLPVVCVKIVLAIVSVRIVLDWGTNPQLFCLRSHHMSWSPWPRPNMPFTNKPMQASQPMYFMINSNHSPGCPKPSLGGHPLKWGLTGKPISLRENLSWGRESMYLGRESIYVPGEVGGSKCTVNQFIIYATRWPRVWWSQDVKDTLWREPSTYPPYLKQTSNS